MKMQRGFMTISRNLTGVNGLNDLLNEPLMPQEFHVPASRGYRKRKLSLVELLFQLQQRDTDTPDACYLMILIMKSSDVKSTTSIIQVGGESDESDDLDESDSFDDE